MALYPVLASAGSTGIKTAPGPEAELRRRVSYLAGVIGDRNYAAPKKLEAAAEYIADEFRACGYKPEFQAFSAEDARYKGDFKNIIAVKDGSRPADPVLILTAHYDTAAGAPGADDNASGVAVLIQLACAAKDAAPGRTVKFLAVANEEPPFFKTADMGSYRYARDAKKRGENILTAVSIESVGYFSDERKSQKYPRVINLFYPDTGNFISLVSNLRSKRSKDAVAAAMRSVKGLSVEDIAVPAGIVKSAGLSDQWSFWEFGYPGLMVTDTAFFRTPYYHTPQDTPEILDYGRMTLVCDGLGKAMEKLAQ